MRVPFVTVGGSISQTARRLWEVDTVRGIAVILMVWYHFMWDLSNFGVFDADMYNGPWQVIGRSIGSMFIFLLGLSATLQMSRGRLAGAPRKASFRSYLIRGIRIFGLGLIITLVTYIATPSSFVIFGILHLLGVSLILLYPFLQQPPWLSLIAGLVAIAVGFFVINDIIIASPWLLWLGIRQWGVRMSDYYPLLPWFGFALLGVFAGRTLYNGGRRSFALPDLGDSAVVRGLSFLGRNSLVIYLLHQPILYGLVFLLSNGRA